MAADYDIAVVGAGPAGLQAAIHAARRKARVVVLGRLEASALSRAHIENYCCLPGRHEGIELLKAGREQAEGFGARFLEEDVVRLEPDGPAFRVELEGGSELTAYALVLATGVSRSGLGLKGEKELVGKGLSYCVDCDAGFYRGKRVAVVGGGSAAADGALLLSKIASEVFLISPEGLSVSPGLRKALEESPVELLTGRKVEALLGEEELRGLRLEGGEELLLDGLFIEPGAKGPLALAGTLGVQLDPEALKYIVTDRRQATNVPGVYAAGDVTGKPFQMAKAVGEGCIAGLEAAAYALSKRRAEGG